MTQHAGLTGRIVRTGDADYPGATAGWNLLFAHDPVAVVFAQQTRNGNFGIVTSLTYKVHPLTQTVYITATWPGIARLPEVFEVWQRCAPYVDTDWENDYWGPNVERLRGIKAKYDPDNVFNFEQSTPLAALSTGSKS